MSAEHNQGWMSFVFSLMVALDKLNPRLLQFLLRGTWMSKPNFIAIHPIVVKIFQSGLKWRTDQHCLAASTANTQLCHLWTAACPDGSRVWCWPEVVVTVENGTVCKQRSVVVVHSVLWRSFLWLSFKATLLQGALWGQTGLLCGDFGLENLQPGGLDPDLVLDHPDQTEDSAAAQ